MNTETQTPKIDNITQALVALANRIASEKVLDIIKNQTSMGKSVKIEINVIQKNGRYIMTLESSSRKKHTLCKLLNLAEL